MKKSNKTIEVVSIGNTDLYFGDDTVSVISWHVTWSVTTGSTITPGKFDRPKSMVVRMPDGYAHVPADLADTLLQPGSEPLIKITLMTANYIGRASKRASRPRSMCVLSKFNGEAYLLAEGVFPITGWFGNSKIRVNLNDYPQFQLEDLIGAKAIKSVITKGRRRLRDLLK